MNYIYPAIFTPNGKGGYIVKVPDLPGCVTDGKSLTEALHMAKDALSAYMCSVEDHKDAIPKPSMPQDIQLQDNESFTTLIEVNTTNYRIETDNRAVRKNVSLPAWLNNKAEQAHINCSQLLQEALRERLGV